MLIRRKGTYYGKEVSITRAYPLCYFLFVIFLSRDMILHVGNRRLRLSNLLFAVFIGAKKVLTRDYTYRQRAE